MSKKERKYKDEADILCIHKEAYEAVYKIYDAKLRAFKCWINMPHEGDCEDDHIDRIKMQQKRTNELLELLGILNKLVDIMWDMDEDYLWQDYDDETLDMCNDCTHTHLCAYWLDHNKNKEN